MSSIMMFKYGQNNVSILLTHGKWSVGMDRTGGHENMVNMRHSDPGKRTQNLEDYIYLSIYLYIYIYIYKDPNIVRI